MEIPCNSLGETDLLVLGAGVAGVALAESWARRGRRVLLCERRCYPLYEVGAWQRHWLEGEDAEDTALCAWLAGLSAGGPEELPFSPDEAKRRAEDRLLDAGARFLYGFQAVSAAREGGGFQVVLANKDGLWAVRAARIADNTDTAVTGPLLGEAPAVTEAYGSGRAWVRVLEVEGAAVTAASWPVPEAFGLAGNEVRLHASSFSPANRILEFAFPRTGPLTAEAAARADLDTGLAVADLCAHLFRLPAFRGARFGALSHLAMPVARLSLGRGLAAAGKLEAALEGGASYAAAWPAGEWGAAVADPVPLPAAWELSPMASGEAVAARLGPLARDRADVAVCGAGVCGAMCGIAAAEAGASTVCADMLDLPGGAGTAGGVHYYWYGHRQGFTRRIDDEYAALSDRLLQKREHYVWGDRDGWNPDLKALLWRRLLADAGARLLTGTFACGCFREGSRVRGVLLSTPRGPLALESAVTADATGDASVARLAGAETISGSRRDAMVMWASLAQYKQAGLYRGGIFTTSADTGNPEDYTRFLAQNRRRGAQGAWDHGAYLTTRESRHLVGEATVDLRDILSRRFWPDAVLRCFSNYDIKGKSWADIVYAGLLPPQMDIDVPYRSLLAPGLEGLLCGGKALSCTHDAAAAIRMQDDMQNLGGAMGLAAARASRSGSVRDVDVAGLQEELAARGALPPDWRQRPRQPSLADTLRSLTGDEPWEWIEMDMNAVAEETPAVARVLLAEAGEAVPGLRALLAAGNPAQRLLAARCLLWHGDAAGAGPVLEELDRMLAAEPLPRRKGSFKFVKSLPDHGVMAEFTYLANLLAYVRHPGIPPLVAELTGRICRLDRDYGDLPQCLFGHVESVAWVAGHWGDPVFLPSLEALLALPEFCRPVLTDPQDQDLDILGERVAYLGLLLAEAAVRCGGKAARALLAAFCRDRRGTLSASAARLLELLPEDGSPCPVRERTW